MVFWLLGVVPVPFWIVFCTLLYKYSFENLISHSLLFMIQLHGFQRGILLFQTFFQGWKESHNLVLRSWGIFTRYISLQKGTPIKNALITDSNDNRNLANISKLGSFNLPLPSKNDIFSAIIIINYTLYAFIFYFYVIYCNK